MVTIIYLIMTRKVNPNMRWILGGLITLLIDTALYTVLLY